MRLQQRQAIFQDSISGFGRFIGSRLRTLASPKHSVAGFIDISLKLQSR